MIFDNFWRHFGAPGVTFRDSVLHWGSQGPPEQKGPKQETHYPLWPHPRRVTFGSILALNSQMVPF